MSFGNEYSFMGIGTKVYIDNNGSGSWVENIKETSVKQYPLPRIIRVLVLLLHLKASEPLFAQ